MISVLQLVVIYIKLSSAPIFYRVTHNDEYCVKVDNSSFYLLLCFSPSKQLLQNKNTNIFLWCTGGSLTCISKLNELRSKTYI